MVNEDLLHLKFEKENTETMDDIDWCEVCHLTNDDFVPGIVTCQDCGRLLCEKHAYLNYGIQCNDCLNDQANEDLDGIY